MKKLLIGLLILNIFSASAATVEDIEAIFMSNKEKIADEIRAKRTAYNELDTDDVFFHRNCEPASRALARYLKDAGIRVKIIEAPKHVYLKYRNLIIDPTYRQFYVVGLNERVRLQTGINNYVVNRDDFKEMPEILIVKKGKLRKTLEGFSLRPEWQVKVGGDYFGFYPSTYDDWYMH